MYKKEITEQSLIDEICLCATKLEKIVNCEAKCANREILPSFSMFESVMRQLFSRFYELNENYDTPYITSSNFNNIYDIERDPNQLFFNLKSLENKLRKKKPFDWTLQYQLTDGLCHLYNNIKCEIQGVLQEKEKRR